jgi:hypothetical protein
MSGKTVKRKTYTRRAPKEKILSKLQKIVNLVERHCGDREQMIEQVAQNAVEKTVASLTPVLPPAASSAIERAMAAARAKLPEVPENYVAAPKVVKEKQPKGAACPGGPILYNKFIVEVHRQINAMGTPMAYHDAKAAASDFWKKIKKTVCFGNNPDPMIIKFARNAAMAILSRNSSDFNSSLAMTAAGAAPAMFNNYAEPAPPVQAVKVKKTKTKKVNQPVVQAVEEPVEEPVYENALPNFSGFGLNGSKKTRTKKNKTKKTKKVSFPNNYTNTTAVIPNTPVMPASVAAAANMRNNSGPVTPPFYNSAPTTPPFYNSPSTTQALPPPVMNASGPLMSIGQSMSKSKTPNYNTPANTPNYNTPNVNNNNGQNIKKVSIDGEEYWMNTGSKGLYKVDEDDSFGAWVGYRQNNGSIRFTDQPNDA